MPILKKKKNQVNKLKYYIKYSIVVLAPVWTFVQWREAGGSASLLCASLLVDQ